MIDSIFQNRSNSHKLIKWALFIGCFAFAVVYFYIFNPATAPYPPCPFYYLTGLYCPGCGSSRAVHQLLHGNIMRAFDLNPLMIISIPFVVYLFFSQFNIVIGNIKPFPKIAFGKAFYRSLLFLILSYWIVRNLPMYPFTVLAP